MPFPGSITKRDFKKERKDLYSPKAGISEVSVPPMTFIAVDGKGPLDGDRMQNGMETLFSLAYAIRMCPMHGIVPEGYYEYTVMPPEGLYGTPETPFDPHDERTRTWKLIIRQPDFVDARLLEEVRDMLRKREPELDPDPAYLLETEKGHSVQVLHVGGYGSISGSADRMLEYMEDREYGMNGAYHETYLSDPSRVDGERLRTILRYPVRPKYR